MPNDTGPPDDVALIYDQGFAGRLFWGLNGRRRQRKRMAAVGLLRIAEEATLNRPLPSPADRGHGRGGKPL